MEEWVREEGVESKCGENEKMKCGVGLKKTVDSGKYPCGVCGKGVKSKFCYLGDMLSAGGGAEEAATTRVRSMG